MWTIVDIVFNLLANVYIDLVLTLPDFSLVAKVSIDLALPLPDFTLMPKVSIELVWTVPDFISDIRHKNFRPFARNASATPPGL